MKFELESTLKGATDEELLDELRRCSQQLGRTTCTMAEFNEIGRGHPTTITRRFGSWPRALELSGLKPSRSPIGISDEDLFHNLRNVWIALNRQPRYKETRSPLSKYSAETYSNRFGTWRKSLERFVEWINDPKGDEGISSKPKPPKQQIDRRTKRNISERQRFRVLLNSGFRCQSCGASPLTSPGTELHVDHIIPWSKGGETVDENLICKCKQCNLGKGNAFDC